MGWRNLVFVESGTFDLDTGTVTAGALTDLADMRLSKRVAIQSSTAAPLGHASIVLHWYMAEADASAIDLIGLLNYRLTPPADASSVVITLSVLGVGGTVDVNDETITQWSPPSEDFPRHCWAILPEGVFDGYWVTIHVDTTTGASGGYTTLECGALWAGPLWCPPDGIDASWSQAIVDPGTMGLSVGGQGYPRRRQRLRSFEGRAVHLPFAWAFGDQDDASVLDVQQLLYRIGKTEPIVLFPRTLDAAGASSTHVRHRLGIYGHMRETGRIEHLGGDLYQWTGVVVDELR
ncbi:MAG: hypothetical protein DYG90_03310 [Chloroflexi bacterium CFX6]|nr:hypothetical protein [Chloroflexi bacterium CFX6]